MAKGLDTTKSPTAVALEAHVVDLFELDAMAGRLLTQVSTVHTEAIRFLCIEIDRLKAELATLKDPNRDALALLMDSEEEREIAAAPMSPKNAIDEIRMALNRALGVKTEK